MAFVRIFFITSTGKVIEKEKQQFILTRHFYFMFLLYDSDDAQRSEHNTVELALFFHFYVGSRYLTQEVKLVQQKAQMPAPLLVSF